MDEMPNHHGQPSYWESLTRLEQTNESVRQCPYNISVYISFAQVLLDLAYPDLAAGAAYRALLLSDAALDEGDEFHDRVIESLHDFNVAAASSDNHVSGAVHQTENSSYENGQAAPFDSTTVTKHYLPSIYRILVRGLFLCGCYRSAFSFCSQACSKFPDDSELHAKLGHIRQAVADRLQITIDAISFGEYSNPANWPDNGFVRREIYPWNTFEPDRLSELSTLNDMMNEVAPKLEVLAVELPNLFEKPNNTTASVVTQLGVFAKEDLFPGDTILSETSILTANNKLHDALCDACSGELPALGHSQAHSAVSCPDCEVVFCSEHCFDQAVEQYHPSLCGMDVESIAKDGSPAQASDALYSLLLLRALAMAETQQCHPLELKEVKYIWGDFHRTESDGSSADPPLSKTLPFSFEHNIRLPFHMLEKMDIDIFANPQYDVWVFNTLYAKFRGTASARLSGLGGRTARGPEVSAVHPMWCLANHSCNPNVSWNWGGSIEFHVRRATIPLHSKDGKAVKIAGAAIKKGEEVLNHYCDIDLPVKERREWAKGALGGDCRCSRCIWEAGEEVHEATIP